MVDYSKWKDIEVSDDEDDTHPNIDTPSLFRWRHQARVERMAEIEKEKDEMKKGFNEITEKKENTKKLLASAKHENDDSVDLVKLQKELKEIEVQEKKWREKEAEFEKKEKLAPWNVDTISKEGFSKSAVNKARPAQNRELTEDEMSKLQSEHIEKYEKEMKQFGMLQRWDDSRQFLVDHSDLVCDETANYLVIWCINLAVEEKNDLMAHVAHQTIVLQFILQLSKSMDRDPRDCVPSFFSRIKMAEDKSYMAAFNDELTSFKQRIQGRAKARIDEATKLAEEEAEKERQERLGPGGLDPSEVFETLPPEMQECFLTKEVGMLQKVMSEMPEEEARKHLKRCIDSGLWIPDAKKAEQENAAKNKE